MLSWSSFSSVVNIPCSFSPGSCVYIKEHFVYKECDCWICVMFALNIKCTQLLEVSFKSYRNCCAEISKDATKKANRDSQSSLNTVNRKSQIW
ncbi:hypothetical protein RIF29_11435 [Crotalaria pallida]|uniref:Uncharacterized protein n=1 Tax=Crotalaria pallida TaxID=3830 RepID=A0AAN9IM37_CROPI